MTLDQAVIGQTYTVQAIVTGDEELNEFLFTLGCYSGEPVVVVSVVSGSYVVSIKDSRYTIDQDLAQAIEVA